MQKSSRIVAFATSILIAAPTVAAAIDAQAVNTANLAAIQVETTKEKLLEPDPAIVKLQVLLDRAGSSPGVVDGLFGENLTKAISGFEALQGLPMDGKPGPEVLAKLTDAVPPVQAYAITADDGSDLVKSIPEDYAKQAEMDHLNYTSIAEKLSERFHMDIGLLKALNPTALFSSGETIAVAVPGTPRTGVVKRIEVRRNVGEAFAFGEDGGLLAV